jgi:hypothetical protein
MESVEHVVLVDTAAGLIKGLGKYCSAADRFPDEDIEQWLARAYYDRHTR